MTKAAALLAIVLLMPGCSGDTPPGGLKEVPAGDRDTALATVTVVITPQRFPDGDLYFEGAVEEVVLIDAEGRLVSPDARRDGTLTFKELAPGPYELRAGLRPCNGSCDQLDPLTDRCSEFLTAEGRVSLQVDLRVGKACSIDPLELGTSARETADALATVTASGTVMVPDLAELYAMRDLNPQPAD